MLSRRAMPVVALAGLLGLLPVGPGRPGAPAYAGHKSGDCRVDRGGPAKLRFAAVLAKNGRVKQGDDFNLNEINDLLIQVRWTKLRQSARQRVELYSPTGELFQMFSATLPRDPDPVQIRIPIAGSWIKDFSLAGAWCVKVFRNDEPDPVGTDVFELRLQRRR